MQLISLPERTFHVEPGFPMITGMEYEPVRDRRYRNLRQLLGAAPGAPLPRGALRRAADKLGKSPGQLSHIAGDAPLKGIGETLAREIEATYGKPAGWLDSEIATDAAPPSQPVGRPPSKMDLALLVAQAWKAVGQLPGPVEDYGWLIEKAYLVLEEVEETDPARIVVRALERLSKVLAEEKEHGNQ